MRLLYWRTYCLLLGLRYQYFDRRNRTVQDIFAGIMIAVVIAVGIWCVWLENFSKDVNDQKESAE